MRVPETAVDARLPYPTRWVEAVGGKVEEYIIPDRDKAAVLEKLYIFDPVPSLYETMFDVHEERHFKVGEFRVVRDGGHGHARQPLLLPERRDGHRLAAARRQARPDRPPEGPGKERGIHGDHVLRPDEAVRPLIGAAVRRP